MADDKPTRPALMPADTPDYMAPAWVGCVSWAITEPDILAAFRADTGNNWTPGKTGLDKMIDQATGSERQFIEQFVNWVNVNVWGPLDGDPDED